MRRGAAAIVLASALAAAACGGSRPEETAQAPPSGEPTPAAGETPPALPALETEPVVVYFPNDEGDRLVGETRTVFKTPQPGDRAKQIVAALLEGPQAGGPVRALPEGTQLRQLYVLDDGTAWADFSSELRDNLGGGSANEIMAVYAVVDSIALNVPGIARVGILVNGRPVETLNGHLDLRRSLPPRRDLVAAAAPKAE